MANIPGQSLQSWARYTEKDSGTPIYVNLDAALFRWNEKDGCIEIYMQGRPVVRLAESRIILPYSEENDQAVEIDTEVSFGPGASNLS